MRTAGNDAHGRRLRGLIVILWRAGLRIQEALALAESDLDPRRGALLVRRGKGGRRREVGMDAWGWQELQPWLERRLQLPVGPLLCVVNGPTSGRQRSTAAARADLRRTAAAAGVRRRFAPHQLRHAHAIELAREGVPLIVVQRQLGHSNLGITSIYLQGIDNAEIIETVHARRQPMIPVSTFLVGRRCSVVSSFLTRPWRWARIARKQGTRWVAACGGVRQPRAQTQGPLPVVRRARGDRARARRRRDDARDCPALRPVWSPSTISRELRRDADRRDGGYRATTAHALACERASRAKPAKLATNLALREIVQDDLLRRLSPEQIAGRLRRRFPDQPEMWVSTETIYQSL